jgi:putative membrane protein
MDGFLPFSRASLMMDIVALSMLAVIPILLFSSYSVRLRKKYSLHKRIQSTLGLILLVVVVLFEIDVRFNGWRQIAEVSPYYGMPLNVVLAVHLVFAVSTSVLWIATFFGAVRNIPSPPGPSKFSPAHRRLARFAVKGMVGTGITGWIFYWMAFVS